MTAIEDLRNLINGWWDLKQEKKDLEARAEKLGSEAAELEMQIIAIMEANDQDDFEGTNVKIFRNYETRARVEQTEPFYNYLKEVGVFDDLISVNARTLNKFVKDTRKAKEEEGFFDYQLPGITTFEQPKLNHRRK